MRLKKSYILYCIILNTIWLALSLIVFSHLGKYSDYTAYAEFISFSGFLFFISLTYTEYGKIIELILSLGIFLLLGYLLLLIYFAALALFREWGLLILLCILILIKIVLLKLKGYSINVLAIVLTTIILFLGLGVIDYLLPKVMFQYYDSGRYIMLYYSVLVTGIYPSLNNHSSKKMNTS